MCLLGEVLKKWCVGCGEWGGWVDVVCWRGGEIEGLGWIGWEVL